MTEDFKVLNDVEHVLETPGMYVGSISEGTYNRFISGKVEEVRIVPALLTITREIIDNSITEFLRSKGRASTEIKININSFSLTVEDNGRGIPVERYSKDDVDDWIPTLSWTKMKSGTSFTKNREGASAHGVGSVASNIFSRVFIGETCDGKNYCRVECSDNMSNIKTFVGPKSGPSGTRVYIEPDFKRFGLDAYNADHFSVIREMILSASSVYPEISFEFNGEKIRCKKPKEYLESYGEFFVSHESKDYFFGILPSFSGEYMHKSSIDGLEFFDGGIHEQYISREVASALKELIQKKHKIEMSVLEIKRGLFLITNGRRFPNMRFNSQSKDRLENTEQEIRAYLGKIPFERIAKNILNIPEIIDPIIQTKLEKISQQEQKEIAKVQKKMVREKVPKHIRAQSKNRSKTTLYVVEGNSALGRLIVVRDVETQGGFPLRGVPKNTYGKTPKEILENKELKNVMSALGLQFDLSPEETIRKMDYGRIGILVDADVDGKGGILPLFLNFLYNWPVLFDKGMVVFVESPVWIAFKGKDRRYFYTQEEYEAAKPKLRGYESMYIKGLGSLEPEDYKFVLNCEEHHVKIVIDDPDCFRKMYSKEVSERKEIMKGYYIVPQM